jgi:hypothetical protein
MVHKGLWNYMTSTIIAKKNVNMLVMIDVLSETM